MHCQMFDSHEFKECNWALDSLHRGGAPIFTERNPNCDYTNTHKVADGSKKSFKWIFKLSLISIASKYWE